VQKTLSHSTPCLTTALKGSLQVLEKQLLGQQNAIEEWFQSQWRISPAPIYGSVDLRNSGFKLAPIDMNLFPAGFNNLNPAFFSISVEAAKATLAKLAPQAKNILLIPESHTRNVFYWESVAKVINILTQVGLNVRVGSLLPDYAQPTEIKLANDDVIVIESIIRKNDIIQLSDFVPDLILLNNDLSNGIPDVLQNLHQPIIPPAELGWSQRLKSEHFKYYAEVCEEFSKLIDIDPWFIAPLFSQSEEIDFMNREAEDSLTLQVEELFASIEKKYRQYDIQCKPFVIVKADAGTYGMAVMTVRNVDEMRSLNRKQRTSMSKSKGGQPVRNVIIQEGIYTFETWGADNAVAEPVVYMIGERVIGGFYRVHQDRGVDENLNSPGMHFEPLAFESCCYSPSKADGLQKPQNRFYAYGVIARLSMLAAAREILQQKGGLKSGE